MSFGSKLEAQFAKILIDAGINWVSQYELKGKYYDFFLPDYNLLVEIDGDYIHVNPETGNFIDKRFLKKVKKNDALKNLIAFNQGFKLKRIWENDLKNINKNNIKEILK